MHSVQYSFDTISTSRTNGRVLWPAAVFNKSANLKLTLIQLCLPVIFELRTSGWAHQPFNASYFITVLKPFEECGRDELAILVPSPDNFDLPLHSTCQPQIVI